MKKKQIFKFQKETFQFQKEKEKEVGKREWKKMKFHEIFHSVEQQ